VLQYHHKPILWGADPLNDLEWDEFPPSNAFRYRIPFTINNSSDSTLTDYQVMFTIYRTTGTSSGTKVYLGDSVNSDFSDIRFFSPTLENLPYWIESSSSSSATIWVKFPSIPSGTSTWYLYYGNASATAVSNGDATFIFFDDFPGTALDTSKWTVVSSDGISVADGLYRVSYASKSDTYGTIRSKPSLGPNIALRTRLSTQTYWTHAGFGAADHSGTGSSIGWVSKTGYESAVYTGVAYGTFWRPPRVSTSASTDGDIITDPPSGWFIDEFAVPASAPLQWRRNDGSWTLSTRYNGITTAQPLELNHYRYYGPMSCDWIAVRSFVPDEPTVSAWGDVQKV